MTTPPAERRGSPVLASLTGILVLAEAGLAALGVTIWNAQRHGHLTGAEAATFVLLGASAAVGAVVYLLGLIALARGAQGRELARLASSLAWLRTAGVLIALIAFVLLIGTSAIAGILETFGAVLAVLDALVAVYVTGVAVRRTSGG
jgi:uncharacterized membrane protein (DUF485 family)